MMTNLASYDVGKAKDIYYLLIDTLVQQFSKII